MILPFWVAAITLSAQPPALDSLVQPSPFSAFETHILSNGLKLWYKRLPGEPVTSVSVAVPFGRDSAPIGREQLAHFTEHMLFSDHLGRSEEEIRREIEERGGVYNASVAADRTFYFVRIGREHGLYALDWLYRVISPHEMDPDVVDRQREPVALEVRARPRQLSDWIWTYYLNPTWLRVLDFWQREFGIATLNSRDYYPYASLYGINSDDLSRFYDTYYSPAAMTLTVVGDIERGEVLELVEKTFATLPARPRAESPYSLRDPERYRQAIRWNYRPNVSYSNRFKFFDLTQEQDLLLIFVSQLLRKRLNDRLRFGERKATYGIRIRIIRRGPTAYLHIGGDIKESEFEFARGVIEEELDALRSGGLPAGDFEADRSAVARRLRVTSSSSEDLERWVRTAFYQSHRHVEFPDLVDFFETVKLEEVEEFSRTNLLAQRQVVTIAYPHPLSQGLLLVLSLTLLGFTVGAARRWLTRPLDMRRIRYVARFKLSLVFRLLGTLLILTMIAIAGRLLVYGYQLFADRFLVRIDMFWLQWIAYAAMFALALMLFVLALATIPRKLLLFEDQLLIKFLSYRSTAILPAEIEEISLRRFREIWLSRRLWKCVPLTFGFFSAGIYLRRRDGYAYFFTTRKRDEFLQLLNGFRSGSP